MQYAVVDMELTVKGETLDDLEIVSFHGQEEISAPYEYVIRFMTSTDTTSQSLAGKQATFKFQIEGLLDKKEPSYVHGYVHVHRVLGLSLQRAYITELVIRPRLSKLALTGQRQVSGTTSAIKMHELAAQLLDPATYKKNTTTAGSFSDEQKIDSDVPSDLVSTKRNFVLQYHESDLNFFMRLLEQEGIFFFVSNDQSKETVQLGDKNQVFKKISGKIDYVPEHLAHAPQTEHVRLVRKRADYAEKKAYVRDYNYDKASQASKYVLDHAVDSDGFGASVSYDDHFQETSDGKRYAQVRAEEALTWQALYEMESNSTRLRPGMLFELDTDERKLSHFNQRYLVVASTVGFSRGMDNVWVEQEEPFVNRLVCVALASDAVTFRPRRVTPKPRVAGLLNATIDNDQNSVEAKLNSNGTYHIRFIEEESDETRLPAGKASADVRQSQPFGGGSETGLQFPLYKGTEVMIGFIEGDPDRPVIVGTVVNSENKSVLDNLSDALNQNKTNRIRTSSGITIEMIDG
ncbi:type VI secretion system Vgr family protein [Amorphus coralli]|uniref:type VI secretion system Vgr family protein n=1 Tax=Amorphus coralli TaxID=340680 RepID=UPI00037BFB1F|nr:type VI secretion system tip protein TssI/VgrG [Amorphus coralli]